MSIVILTLFPMSLEHSCFGGCVIWTMSSPSSPPPPPPSSMEVADVGVRE